MSLLIKNARYVIVSADQTLAFADVLVEGNRIADVGFNLPADDADRVIDASGKLVLPGFVNTHTHLYQNMLKGKGDTYALKEWCEKVTFPFSKVIHRQRRECGDDSLGYAYGILGAIEMLRSGITSFVDMDTVSDSLLLAWEDLGIRGRAAVQTVNRWVPDTILIPEKQKLSELEALIETWHGRGLQDIYIGPSTVFTCTTDFFQALKKLAVRYDVRLQIHVSETKWEVHQAIREYGMTPLQYLDAIGLLEDPIIAVHCIHLTEREMTICRDRGLFVSYNPKSNGKLGNGIAPIVELNNLSVKLCLATDGAASNDLLDMFEEMRFGVMLQKIRFEDPACFCEKDIFHMATQGGASAIGLDAGTVTRGKLADLILMDINVPAMSPLHDPVSAVVYCGRASDVETVIIDGKIIMENKEILTIDADQKLADALSLGTLRSAEMSGPLNTGTLI